ncbi:MAG: Homoserine kinase [Candidatus Heimdallarchaeota archaeon LC_2]|nr:MAG: Homoserine kinase [Candidatus Heimdallarchaeota archaeon LC_2]
MYTNFNSVEIEEISQEYSIGEIIKYYPMSGGFTNSSYFIQTMKQKYILTISEGKTEQQVVMIANLLNHLQQHHFQTNEVIQSRNEEFVFLFNNKPIYLKKFLEGTIAEKPNVKFIEQLGTQIAKLNNIPVPDTISSVHPYGLSYFDEVISTDLDHPYIEWLRTKSNYLQESIPDHLPKGLVHGDIFPDNLIQTEGNLKAIIDFEEFSNSPKIFDLGMATIGMFSDFDAIDMNIPRALIKGYQKVRLLDSLERQNLKLFIIYAAVATSFWRFRQFHILFPNLDKSRRYEQMVNFADSFFVMDNYKFMSEIFD